MGHGSQVPDRESYVPSYHWNMFLAADGASPKVASNGLDLGCTGRRIRKVVKGKVPEAGSANQDNEAMQCTETLQDMWNLSL
jgi:hypothetical protein